MNKFIISIIALLLFSCGTYQLAPVDKCCETDVVYLDEIKGDSVNIFTKLEFNTITLDFRPLRPRFYWGHNYGYWGHRPLWLDFDYWYNDFYYTGYYSYFYRPWNYWDWYMRPWRPYNDWYQGPFNNQGYNVVYNASRRGSLTSISNTLRVNRNKPRVNVNKPVVDNFIANYKPNNNINNNIRVKPNNNWKPDNNNNIIIKPNNNYSRPSNNYSKPSNNYSRPSNNVISRPSSTSRGGKIN
jgi:hypothetical protein